MPTGSSKANSCVGFNSFFAGIGGFDLALATAGFSPKAHSEINKFCKLILKKHWPSVPNLGDITQINDRDIPSAPIWCGGFPCQDVSVARGAKGRDGLKGKNSGLFFPFFELIKTHRPEVVLLENVTGLLSSHNGQDFRVILEAFIGEGYSVAWRVMNSRYFGSPQSRPRVFICAARNNSRLPLEVLYEGEKGSGSINKRKGFLEAYKCNATGAQVAEVAYCLAATSGRHTGTDWSRTYVSYDASVRRLTPNECEGLQGFPKDWTLPVDGNNRPSELDTPRYQALGNAVAVPVVGWIAQRLRQSSLSLSVPSLSTEEIQLLYPDFASTSVRFQNISELHYSTKPNGHFLKWKSGGYVSGDVCIDIKAPEAPSKIVTRKLITVIDKHLPDERYFISPNAAEGILRRVTSQNRTLFGPMHEALTAMTRSLCNA